MRKTGGRSAARPAPTASRRKLQGVEQQVIDVESPTHAELPALDESGDAEAREQGALPAEAPEQQARKQAEGDKHNDIPQQDVAHLPEGLEGNQVDIAGAE